MAMLAFDEFSLSHEPPGAPNVYRRLPDAGYRAVEYVQTNVQLHYAHWNTKIPTAGISVAGKAPRRT